MRSKSKFLCNARKFPSYINQENNRKEAETSNSYRYSGDSDT